LSKNTHRSLFNCPCGDGQKTKLPLFAKMLTSALQVQPQAVNLQFNWLDSSFLTMYSH